MVVPDGESGRRTGRAALFWTSWRNLPAGGGGGGGAAWPHTPGTSTGIAEALQLSRWEGSYGI
ncbi:hypothetical protein, partial [Streptomyces tendae]|uniref:hypothetical protein n=1 Tax=Streptomyces tendae TaxID=1932 RepID=UPI0034410677